MEDVFPLDLELNETGLSTWLSIVPFLPIERMHIIF